MITRRFEWLDALCPSLNIATPKRMLGNCCYIPLPHLITFFFLCDKRSSERNQIPTFQSPMIFCTGSLHPTPACMAALLPRGTSYPFSLLGTRPMTTILASLEGYISSMRVPHLPGYYCVFIYSHLLSFTISCRHSFAQNASFDPSCSNGCFARLQSERSCRL